MNWLTGLYDGFARLFSGEALLLTLIFVLASVLWALIFERYWYFLFVHPDVLENALQVWNRRSKGPVYMARRARRHILLDVGVQMSRYVTLIQPLVIVIFLLGLLGSIGGMINVLDALTVSGDASTLALSRSIGTAAIPMVTALAVVVTGVVFGQELKQRVDREARLLRDKLRRG